jgi:hypothetical protein
VRRSAACGGLLGVLAALAGCGAQDVLLGTGGEYLFTVSDALAAPNQAVRLRARLQAGDFLAGRQGRIVRFWRDGALYKLAQTDDDGAASVTFTPTAAGDYVFLAEVAPIGLAGKPPPPRALRVACRRAETPVCIVDLDKTLVASGFQAVLVGRPEPMPDSPRVMGRIAEDHTIVYLTHRPRHFGPKTKAWLRQHAYPAGPVLLSTVGGFLSGSGEYKARMLAELKRRHSLRIGIGDKVSDAAAYHRHGLRAFLVSPPPGPQVPAADIAAFADELATLPEGVQVVTSWAQIEKALYGGATFPRGQAERRLRELAERRKASEASDDR